MFALFQFGIKKIIKIILFSYTHLRAHETVLDLVCRLLLEKKKKKQKKKKTKTTTTKKTQNTTNPSDT